MENDFLEGGLRQSLEGIRRRKRERLLHRGFERSPSSRPAWGKAVLGPAYWAALGKEASVHAGHQEKGGPAVKHTWQVLD